jgi:hypothetical protein
MACADQLDMILKARRNSLRAMCVAFDKLNDLLFFLFLPPFLEGIQVVED